MPPLDDASFDNCYRRVFPMVLAKCRRMLKSDADAHDVAQEVFVRLWKHRELLQNHAALVAWLYRTSTHLVIDRARQRSLSQENLAHLHGALHGEPTRDSEARFVSREQLRGMLSSCSEQELEVAVLNRVDRLTQPEIAELMGIGERTVRRLLGRFDERTGSLKEVAS
jgi:RNA polymerase sigma-70 factor (ECF subfamily)